MAETTRFHVALNVPDLERSMRFYTDVLGLAPDKVRRGYARFLVDDPALALSLNQKDEVRGGNRLAHFGIRLGSPGALVTARARVVAAGHQVRDQEATLCCHAVQDKFWVTDPDGTEWELYHVTDDDPERRALATPPSSAASGCCS